MLLLGIVLSGFLLATVAPWLHRVLGRFAGVVIAMLPLGICVLLGTRAADIAAPGGAVVESFEWVPGMGVSLDFRLDGLGLLMAMLVSGIGAAIFIYAGGYLKGERQLGRLYAYLLMFMGSMLGVVLADNLLLLFVFWELTSVSSYLLIGYDHAKAKSRSSALQALLVTGLGGLAILAAALMLADVAGTMTISELAARSDVIHDSPLSLPIMLLLIFGACTKSAQFPFHFWLPNAMAAPTPVSAYLHSSTMVKAGIYLLARFSPVFAADVLWAPLLTWIGAATMFVGAWLAIRQSLLKPLLAYSTISALGAIVMSIGVGSTYAVEAGMVFLLSHAFYKGALFMAAGAIDHETGEKDVDKLGGLGRAMPLLFAATALAGASMAGILPFLGFTAKELTFKALLKSAAAGPEGIALVAVFTISAAFGVVVAARIGLSPFIGKVRPTPVKPHDPPLALMLGPALLAVLGLAAAIIPAVLAMPLVRPAASAILAAEANPDLSLWHGFNLALGLSVTALVVGALVYVMRRGVVGVTEPLQRVLNAIGPAKIYDWALSGVIATAKFQTRALQSGYLRQYVFVTISTTVITMGITLALRGGLGTLPKMGEVRTYEAALVGLILVGAVFTGFARNRLAAIAGLGLVGYGIAILFVLFGAPDLSLTQICIETLTVVLMVLVFYMLPDFRNISAGPQKIRDMIVAGAVGAVMASLVLLTGGLRSGRDVSEFYAANSLPEAHGRNIVNVILVDFRALDTLGEITVLIVAAAGVYALMKVTPARPKREQEGGAP
ncbi:MAG: putative monovalent cation/H+ antiporter subunit A [Phycisphaeraceae bacterium]|nr:putative monovalent cation/H+ antiporter subunit A [Phycisphaeraceae bacterium]MCW5753221.1 putative monovalent cation/H+ antiporter subunit A [Phycisphaeraceae bacterium]